jgi:iron complex outermembrane receptor protein
MTAYAPIIDHPSAWTAKDIGSREGLTYHLTEAQLNAVAELLAKTAHMQPQEPTREDFSHPDLDDWLAEVFDLIQNGRGAIIIAGIDPAVYSHEQMERIYWGFSTHWGIAAVQSALGDRLGRVTFTPVGPDNPTGRAYRSTEELYLHTDNYEIVGLMCLEKAEKGGFSRLASSVAIHNEVVANRPDLLKPLYEGYYYASREAAASGKPVTDYKIPVYSYIDGQLSCRYTREFIYRAGETLGGLPDNLSEALAYINEIADRDDMRLHFTLEPGEIMIINNYTTLHSRTNFQDSPTRKRSLLRLWLDVPGGRAVAPEFMSSAVEYGKPSAKRVSTAALIAGAMLGSVAFGSADTAFAQAADEDVTSVDAIVVTGSLIARGDVNSPSPITVVAQEQILEAGTLSLSDVLRQDPALGSSSRGPANSLSGAGYVGVNMRNLGNRRTLVLVNGKRYPLFADLIANAGQDISAIPTSMIGQIDVLRDGASTTYGADAVAGVVNFVLNDSFDGARMDAYVGQSTHGDGLAYRLSGVFGSVFDRGSITVSAQLQEQEAIAQDRRGWAAIPLTSLGGAAGASGSSITSGGRVTGPGGLIACYPLAGGANVAPSCPIDYDNQGLLISGSTLRSVGAVVRYDVADNVEFRLDTFISRRETELNAGAQTINTAGTTGPFGLGFAIPSANSNNPYGADVRLQWAPTQYGSRPTQAATDMFWGSIGFAGQLWDRYSWELTHTYGSNDINTRQSNTINANAFHLMLNPALCGADVGCARVGAIPNIANLLSGATPLTDAQQGYLFFDQTSDSKFVSQQTLATLTGPLFEVPAGEVHFAVGLERREESGGITPDPITQSGMALGNFVNPGYGEFTTTEVFGELDIPLLRDVPGAVALDLNLQARYSDFSNFGGADTYKIGVNYEPVEGVRFRLTYGTSYRAPDVLELYGEGTGATAGLQDPCNATGFRAVNATAAANCTALGVPAGYNQIGGSLPVLMGGNPLLTPEQGETFTVGVVLRPTFLPNFTATIDYYNIEIEDAISAANQTALMQSGLNNCYAATDFAARAADPSDLCYTFATRGVDGTLGRIRLLPTNIAQWATSGVDMSFRYRWDELSFVPGALTADLRLSYLESFNQAGDEVAGTFAGGSFGDLNYPEWQGALKLGYERDSFDVEWTVNYMDSMADIRYGTSVPANNFLGYSGVPTYFSHDLIVRTRLIDNVDLTLGVNNVFDKDPPYAFVSTRNTLPTAYDQLGRYVFLLAQYRF